MPCLSILLRENSPPCPTIRALLPSRDLFGLLRINNALRMLGPDIVRTLDFKGTSVDDDTIRAAIYQFRHATTVILEWCFMIRGIMHLGLTSLEYLRTLNLSGTEVTDVSALAACGNLHTLNLHYTQVTDVSALGACGNLHTLYLPLL